MNQKQHNDGILRHAMQIHRRYNNIVNGIRTQKSTCFRHIEKHQETNGFGIPII